MTSTLIVPILVTTRITHFLLHSQVLNFEKSDFKFPCILVWGYEFHAIKVLPHPPYLKHYPPPPLDLLPLAVDLRKIFPPLGLEKGILTLSCSLIPPLTPLIKIRNRNMKYCSQPTSSFL